MIDPLLKHCTGCEYTFYVSTLQKLRMLLFGEIIITCPNCGCRMTFRLVCHTVKVDSDVNKCRMELWKRC